MTDSGWRDDGAVRRRGRLLSGDRSLRADPLARERARAVPGTEEAARGAGGLVSGTAVSYSASPPTRRATVSQPRWHAERRTALVRASRDAGRLRPDLRQAESQVEAAQLRVAEARRCDGSRPSRPRAAARRLLPPAHARGLRRSPTTGSRAGSSENCSPMTSRRRAPAAGRQRRHRRRAGSLLPRITLTGALGTLCRASALRASTGRRVAPLVAPLCAGGACAPGSRRRGRARDAAASYERRSRPPSPGRRRPRAARHAAGAARGPTGSRRAARDAPSRRGAIPRRRQLPRCSSPCSSPPSRRGLLRFAGAADRALRPRRRA